MTKFYVIPRNPYAAKTSMSGRLQRREGRFLAAAVAVIFVLEFFIFKAPPMVALAGFLVCVFPLFALHLCGVRGLPPLLYLLWLVKFLATRKKYSLAPIRRDEEKDGEEEEMVDDAKRQG